jgi:hypothetical protein
VASSLVLRSNKPKPGAAAVSSANTMYEIKTKRSVKPGSTFIAEVDGSEIELKWRDQWLIADGDPRRILGSWIEDDSRIICCLETPESSCEYCIAPMDIPTKEKGESAEHFSCRLAEAVISRHGLEPAANGRHKITHLLALENPDSFIPCRKSSVEVSVGQYQWSGAYQKAAPATV